MWVEGNLTLLGITRRLTFTITAFGCGMNSINGQIMCGIGATANMKRSSFGMKYALPIVGDEIKLMIEATGYQG
ncbi:YceI family protein [Nitrosomonas cryotolerans]|uniref:YceI family protein n=1 Tax=Nitrosomonas cryotolerans TaxID=44575 RepID=UPI0009F298B0|nr:YceI family protein [Nitrosomonas cryotolerans]